MKLKLNKFFAPNTKVDEYDTRSIKRILNRLGYYMPPKEFGSTHIPDRAVFEALKAFQKDNNLLISSELRPGDDTEKALNEAVKNQDPNAEYIWHTQQDDRVRKTHAEREGETFTWGNPPADGHPGEPYNCRCWAEKKKKRKCFDNGPSWKDQALSMLASPDHENIVPYPYLDSEFLITIGMGFNVNTKSDFMTLPLVSLIDRSRPASEQEKNQAYELLQKMADQLKSQEKKAPSHSFYEHFTQLQMSEKDIINHAKKLMNSFTGELEEKFPDFSCYPDPSKIALMDLIYNIGGNHFNSSKWPSLFGAVKNRNWAGAAVESHRKGVREERNENIKALFLEAEIIEKSEEN